MSMRGGKNLDNLDQGFGLGRRSLRLGHDPAVTKASRATVRQTHTLEARRIPLCPDEREAPCRCGLEHLVTRELR